MEDSIQNSFINFQNQKNSSQCTTMSIGEEGGSDEIYCTTQSIGEEGGSGTTMYMGEDGGVITQSFYKETGIDGRVISAPAQELAKSKDMLNVLNESVNLTDGSLKGINNSISQATNQLQMINLIKSFMPSFASLFEGVIENLNNKINALNIVKDNFDTFSKSGEAGKIDAKDINNFTIADNADGDIESFSDKDLKSLKGNTEIVAPKSQPKVLANTDSLVTTIQGASRGAETTTKKDLYNLISQDKVSISEEKNKIAIDPQNKAIYESNIKILEADIQRAQLVLQNFGAFSQNGQADVIEASDIGSIREAAASDGTAGDFSDKDLERLKQGSFYFLNKS